MIQNEIDKLRDAAGSHPDFRIMNVYLDRVVFVFKTETIEISNRDIVRGNLGTLKKYL